MPLDSLIQRGNIKLVKKTWCERVESLISRLGKRYPLGGVPLNSFGRSHALILTLTYITCILLTVGIQLWQNVELLVSQNYVSLSPDTKGTECRVVPNTLIGTFEASYKGYWETDIRNFHRNESAFVMKLNGAQFTSSDYERQMDTIAKELAVIGRQAQSRNVLSSLIYWATFKLNHPYLFFYSSAEPGVIFNGQIAHANMASTNGVCDVVSSMSRQLGRTEGFVARPLSAKYDISMQKIILRMPVIKASRGNAKSSSMIMVQPCPEQGNWTDRSGKNRFTNAVAQFADLRGELGFDVRSTLLAVSLNLQVVNVSSLQESSSELLRNLGLMGYVDATTMPPMSPVYCLEKERALDLYGIFLTPAQMDGPPICMLADSFRTNTIFFFYPSLFQLKSDANTMYPWNFTQKTLCKCPDDALNEECNGEQSFYFTYFYDMNFTRQAVVEFAARMQKVVISGGADALEKTLWKIPMLTNIIKSNADYGVSKRSHEPITSFIRRGVFFDNSWANGRSLSKLLTDEFQSLCAGNCAAITLSMSRMLGRTDLILPLNQYNLQLGHLIPNTSDPNQYFTYTAIKLSTSQQNLAKDLSAIKMPYTMCKDTFSQAEAMARLAARPPIPLVAKYFDCHRNVQSALLTVFGSVVTSSLFYVSLAWILLGFIYTRVYRALFLPEGAILLTASQMETVKEVETDIEKAKTAAFLDGLQLYVDQRASAAELRQRIAALSEAYGAVLEPADNAAVWTMGHEISRSLARSADSKARSNEAHAWDNPNPSRRITMSPARASLASSKQAMPDRPLSQRRSSSINTGAGLGSVSGRRASFNAHPLEMVLSKTRPTVFEQRL